MKESEVREALRLWFRARGYTLTEDALTSSGNKIDLVAESGHEVWYVEAKGDYDASAAQYNVNFDTGMGQLLKSITRLDDHTKYAIAIPFSRTERHEKLSYRRILPKYAASLALGTLSIHLLLVRDDMSVEVIAPDDAGRFLASVGKTADHHQSECPPRQNRATAAQLGPTSAIGGEFVVYVNHPTSAATVHASNCGIYRNRKANETANGYWTCPFPDRERAHRYASRSGKKNVRTCSKCTWQLTQ